ncbi:MAG: hypothetical protein DMF83_25545 [Acidobacteria bacterium]|nr:MAG: hypothetical protein DMF83_25545 [Acidobacteriota bacterium]
MRDVSFSVSDNAGAGVLGYSERSNAVAGITVSGTAGYFEGKVIVLGDFTVAKGAKSAAVPHPDGSYRRLYSLESPESFFEDFGRARLARGKAYVELDRDFAALVRRTDYYVFGSWPAARTSTERDWTGSCCRRCVWNEPAWFRRWGVSARAQTANGEEGLAREQSRGRHARQPPTGRTRARSSLKPV